MNEPEPVVYRLEVLTIMEVLGDIRYELVRIRRALEEDGGETEEDEDGAR